MGKKLTPQEAWQETIQIAAETAPQSIKSHMDQLAMMENVPRKVKPFKNFTVNSLRFKGAGYDRVKDEIWNHLMKVRDDEKQKKEAQMKQQSSSQQTAKKDTKKDSEAKSVSDDDKSSKEGSTNEDKESPSSLPSQKVVTKAVKKALKKAPNKSIKFKTLRKQVQEALALKTTSSNAKKEWKKLLKQCVNENSKKFVVDSKMVSLRD